MCKLFTEPALCFFNSVLKGFLVQYILLKFVSTILCEQVIDYKKFMIDFKTNKYTLTDMLIWITNKLYYGPFSNLTVLINPRK